MLAGAPSSSIFGEVPSFMASDPANVESLLALSKAGNTLLIKGRPVREVPREVLHCFTYSIVDLAEDRRIGGQHLSRMLGDWRGNDAAYALAIRPDTEERAGLPPPRQHRELVDGADDE